MVASLVVKGKVFVCNRINYTTYQNLQNIHFKVLLVWTKQVSLLAQLTLWCLYVLSLFYLSNINAKVIQHNLMNFTNFIIKTYRNKFLHLYEEYLHLYVEKILWNYSFWKHSKISNLTWNLSYFKALLIDSFI